MNIFCLDENPVIAAQYHCDKHCCKLILESAQLLCTAFHLQGIDAPYRKTHENHPSSIWTRKTRGNFEWLVDHSDALAKEYTFRYGKIHKTSEIISWIKQNKHRLNFDSDQLTDFAIAISPTQTCRQHPEFDKVSTVEKYRLYYLFEKAPFCKWTKREVPDWFSVNKTIINKN